MSPNITIYSIPYHICLFVYFICWHISVTLRLKIQRDKPTTTFGLTKPHGMCLIKRARKPNTKHGLFYVPNKPSPKPFFYTTSEVQVKNPLIHDFILHNRFSNKKNTLGILLFTVFQAAKSNRIEIAHIIELLLCGASSMQTVTGSILQRMAKAASHSQYHPTLAPNKFQWKYT